MTGAYLRVKRDGVWTPIEVEHLTDAERVDIFASRGVEEILRWLDCVCNKLAQIENEHFVKVEE